MKTLAQLKPKLQIGLDSPVTVLAGVMLGVGIGLGLFLSALLILLVKAIVK